MPSSMSPPGASLNLEMIRGDHTPTTSVCQESGELRITTNPSVEEVVLPSIAASLPGPRPFSPAGQLLLSNPWSSVSRQGRGGLVDQVDLCFFFLIRLFCFLGYNCQKNSFPAPRALPVFGRKQTFKQAQIILNAGIGGAQRRSLTLEQGSRKVSWWR